MKRQSTLTKTHCRELFESRQENNLLKRKTKLLKHLYE
jgi:hypothetical protein